MPFRDDYEALLARVSSLERELEGSRGDRARLERELAEARASLTRADGAASRNARDAPRSLEDGDAPLGRRAKRRDRGSLVAAFHHVRQQWWGNLGLLVVASVALLGTFALYSDHVERAADASGPGKLRSAFLAPLDDGSRALVLLESVVHPGGEDPNWERPRVDVVDPGSGARRARVSADGFDACASAGPGRLWCSSKEGLELRDTATLHVFAGHAQIVAKTPAFAKRHDDPCIDARTGEAWTLLDDGRYLRTDPRTLAGVVEELAPERTSCLAMAPSTVGTASVIDLPGEETVQPAGGSGPRTVLEISGADRVWRTLADVAFLRPRFLVDSPTTPLLLEGGRVFLVVHAASVDAASPLVVTAMGTDGVRRWTQTLGPGTIAASWVVGERVLIAMEGTGGYVVALAAADGKTVWKYET